MRRDTPDDGAPNPSGRTFLEGRRWLEATAGVCRTVAGYGQDMKTYNDLPELTRPADRSVDHLLREARDSLALVLVTLAILVTVSLLGLVVS